jgi:hypothetical protein
MMRQFLEFLPEATCAPLFSNLTWFTPKEALLMGAVDRVRARHDIFGGLRKDLDSLLGATCLITFKTSVPLQ